MNEALVFIENIVANGGGDTPEAVEAGLKEGLAMRWDTDARKMIFLIGDAPPHGVGTSETSYQNGPPVTYNYKDMIQEAQEKQVRIFTLSGSGMDQNGVQVWKHIAVKTGGSYTQLYYERVQVDDYFADEGIDVAYASEVAAAPDYDYETRSFKANNLADVAEQSIMQEATAAGVVYNDFVATPEGYHSEPLPEDFYEEFPFDPVEPNPQSPQTIWDKILNWIIFWR